MAERVIGIPQQVSGAGVVESLPIAAAWLDRLSDALAFGKLDEWGATVAEDPQFAALVYRTLMMGDMGGQMIVRQVEVPESSPRAVKLDRVDQEAFFALPFDEAIRVFLERKLISPAEYRRLSDEARARAFSVSRMTSTELVRRVREVLGRTLEDGGDYREFVRQIREGEVDLGIAPTAPGYLENIFRTNTQSAYGAGRLRQITTPEVMAARPFVEYRTARDSRVRPNHAALEGVVFRQDDPGWRRYAPPLGYQCRCAIVTRRQDAVDLTRVRDSATLDVEPDPGFGNPTI